MNLREKCLGSQWQFLDSVVWCRKFKMEFRDRSQCIKMTYGTDKASVMPAVAQRLKETVPCINLEVTAMAFGTKHLFIVCREKQTNQKGPIKTARKKCLVREQVKKERKKERNVLSKGKRKGITFSQASHAQCVITDTGPDSYMDCPSFTHYGKLKSCRLYVSYAR